MNLSRDEMETHISQTAQERIDNVLHIYSDDEVWIRKIEKLGIGGAVVNGFGGKEYKVDMNDYSLYLRKKPKMTDAQRAQASDRMKKLQNP